VINLTIVLADGTIIKTRRRPRYLDASSYNHCPDTNRKSSAGYNLNNLFIGSEGTLGMVTEITLKLAVLPQETSVAVVTFPTIRDAAAAASKVMRAGIPIAAMEIMDDIQMRIVNKAGSSSKKWNEVPTMFFK
jgi:D-lactate dehydrogenase (cytochrome)